MGPVYRRWKYRKIPCLALYVYNSTIRTLLYQFKGCGDYELKDVFFGYPAFLLHLRYRGYTIVPAPSSKSHNEKRGFNQVVAMCECLKLPMGFYLEKRVEAKQSDLSAKERAKIGKYMAYVGPSSLKNKKILFVDDVYTTGSTAKSCLDLLLERNPKKLALLVMSRGVMK